MRSKGSFQAQQTVLPINLGHGRIEKATVSITDQLDAMPDFPGLSTLIRVESEGQIYSRLLGSGEQSALCPYR
ncbi:hypothetical protein BJP36_16205 [Moorena producens JHB]|uniref:Uncharacterized protein n=1 Tax=Moorena producens (strain JHB) TaxID=1454205 RepID=A0A1D9G122_MOOP1|nr:hypothetical protein [Moorena producens]AOY81215.1 hypothetical protein BJP36_16205 [Moorena producens JHB]ARO38314.1 hypothetical protein [Moorena producens JHB]